MMSSSTTTTKNAVMKCRHYFGIPTTCLLSGLHHNNYFARTLFRNTYYSKDAVILNRRRVYFSSLHFEPGEKVGISNNDDGGKSYGIIRSRSGGWYTIETTTTSSSSTSFIKRRAKDLQKTTAEEQSTTPSNVIYNVSNDTNHDIMVVQSPQRRSKDADDEVIRASSFAFDSNTTTHKVPVIIDLDAACLLSEPNSGQQPHYLSNINIDQCKYISEHYSKWVVFSDLHCSPSTLQTCLQVLRFVFENINEKGMGILFLGDWWHHRGVVRFDCLNAVLGELKKWDAPLLMIPGNHDQIYLEGGESHGLTPLANAFYLPVGQTLSKGDSSYQNIAIPGPLILSHATKFLNAFFVPHVRNITTLEEILASPEAHSSDALFIHADVTGAYMNNHIVSEGGVSLSKFPPHRPIYSGHFHKPHLVQAPIAAPGVTVRYVGSPYEVSLAEAGQKKSLLVLDSSKNWEVARTIPLEAIGPRHYRFTSIADFLNNDYFSLDKIGDDALHHQHRVVVSVSQRELADMRNNYNKSLSDIYATNTVGAWEVLCPFDAKVKLLRKFGAKVEIREEADARTANHQDASFSFPIPIEDMAPTDVLSLYFSSQVNANRSSNYTAARLIEAGTSLIEEVLSNSENGTIHTIINASPGAAAVREVDFHSVTIEGYGSFKDAVVYPLIDRGLVLIRGSNLDGGYDSNGSGKTTLAMSILWALTGSLDLRPMQDSKVSDVVNQDSKFAKVTVHGVINSKPFVISRTKTATRSGLVLIVDGNDLTKQSVKETQATMEEVLGLSQIFVRSMFWGQHQLNGLLESTDGSLKDELSLIVPLVLWQETSTLARTKARALSKEVSEIEGMLAVRNNDVEAISQRCHAAKTNLDAVLTAIRDRELHLKERINELSQSINNVQTLPHDVDILRYGQLLNEATLNTSKIEQVKTNLINQKEESMKQLQEKLEHMLQKYLEVKMREQASKRAFDKAESSWKYAKMNLEKRLQAWGNSDVHLHSKEDDALLVCPMCSSPVDESFREQMINEITKLKEIVVTEEQAKETAWMKEQADAASVLGLDSQIKNLRSEIKVSEQLWKTKFDQVENDLEKAQNIQHQRSNDAIAAASTIEAASKLRALEVEAVSELSILKQKVSVAEGSYDLLLSELKSVEGIVRDLEAKREVRRNMAATMTNLVDAFGPRGIQTFILQNIVIALEAASQIYLDELSEGQQRLAISLEAGDRISRTASIRGPDGCWIDRPLSSLSGGQWRRCSLAVTLGFADLVCSKGKLRSSLLVLDEPLTHLDSLGRSKVGKLLKKLLQEGGATGTLGMRTILIILQDLAAEELEESFDRIDEVRKTDGTSVVLVDQ